jgi:hypothetical protein
VLTTVCGSFWAPFEGKRAGSTWRVPVRSIFVQKIETTDRLSEMQRLMQLSCFQSDPINTGGEKIGGDGHFLTFGGLASFSDGSDSISMSSCRN